MPTLCTHRPVCMVVDSFIYVGMLIYMLAEYSFSFHIVQTLAHPLFLSHHIVFRIIPHFCDLLHPCVGSSAPQQEKRFD